MNVLVCLIGSNPLPNYVVSKYLLMNDRKDSAEIPVPDKVIFLHSTKTEKYANNIRNKLEQKEKVRLVSLWENERDQGIIRSTIFQELDQLDNIKSIHLNFTGGTKPMSVHSYAAVYEYVKNKNISITSSDIDPKTNRIKLDNGNQYISSNLRDKIIISIKDVLELHDMEIDEHVSGNIGYKDITYDINIERLKNNIIKERNFYSIIYSIIDKFEKEQKKKYNTNDSFPKRKFIKDNNNKEKMILLGKAYNSTILRDFKKLSPDFPFNGIEEMNSKEFIEFLEFIKGKWLEDYIQYKILQVKDQYAINEVVRSLEAHYAKRPCEIDVVAIKGYEMYLFSCTTSNKIKTVKGKAFEVMYRSNQLGGDHSKAIIVNLMPDKSSNEYNKNNNKELEKDLSSFDAKTKIYIIGYDDIKDEKKLDLKLKQIFQG